MVYQEGPQERKSNHNTPEQPTLQRGAQAAARQGCGRRTTWNRGRRVGLGLLDVSVIEAAATGQLSFPSAVVSERATQLACGTMTAVNTSYREQ